MKGVKGPYGGGAAVILPGAETPMGGGRGSKETWADVTEDAASGGQEGWQRDHRNTLAQWKLHQPGATEGIDTPSTPAGYMASMNAMMKAMAKEQNELRERVEAEKEARANGEALQHHQHQGVLAAMHELATLVAGIKEDMKQTREGRTSRSRDKSTSRTFRRSDSVRGRKERSGGPTDQGGERASGTSEPRSRRQRTQLEDGDDRKMIAASVSSSSE